MPSPAATMLFCGIMLAASSAWAQLNPFPGRAPKLTHQDLVVLEETTTKLNNAPSASVGETMNWSNPATGAHGTVALTRRFHHQAMACHALRYEVSPNQTRSLRTYNVDWCKTADGQWKILS